MSENVERDGYLLGGRRVRMSDLLRAGLLSPHTKLVFRRPRIGATYEATILETGEIELQDGRRYASPSRAAVAAAGGSLDGWHAWQVAPDGAFLDTLRQQMLDQAATADRSSAVAEADTAFDLALTHHQFLKNARQQAATGSPLQMTVRELLARWRATGRSQPAAEQITADLDNHGLTTDPNFLKTGLDTEVSIVERRVEGEVVPSDAEDPKSSSSGAGTDLDDSAHDVGMTLGNLPAANFGVEAVSPQSSFDEAVTKMLLNDYSQLAVMAGPRSFKGAITWQSIARERHANPDASLADAIIPAEVRDFDTELIDVLTTLEEHDFLFVRDGTTAITGIVTTADVVRAYGQLATPFFLVGELDQLLRRVIADRFTFDQVRSFCDSDGDRDLQSVDELTMGDYERILQSESNWKSLAWPLDRRLFTTRLAALRRIRNDIMHFNPDPIPEGTVSQIRHMIRLLRRYGLDT